MKKIAIISEGITDQYVLKPIIENYYKDNSFKFNPISPSVDETDKQTGYGNWFNVITACKTEDFDEILFYNDFVLIHIDADVSHKKGFDVQHYTEGQKRSSQDLCEAIVKKLESIIPNEVYEKHSNKFIFAIGMLTIECWLIPTIVTENKKQWDNNCLYKLNRLLKKQNKNTINKDDKNNYQSRKIYKELAANFRNAKKIKKYAKQNVGFSYFLEELKKIQAN